MTPRCANSRGRGRTKEEFDINKSTCERCGERFTPSKGRGRPRKKCFACAPYRKRYTPKRGPTLRACDLCGDEFEAFHVGRKYCSDLCSGRAKAYRLGISCIICGELMVAGASTSKDSPAHRECRVAVHGTAGAYDRGCRCSPCREAKTQYMREYRSRYKAKHGTSPSKRYKRERRGVPVEDQVCVKCGEPLNTSYFHKDVEPMHKECRGSFYVSRHVRRGVYERDDWMCRLCGEPTEPNSEWHDDWHPTLDHIIPRSKGGDHGLDNLRTAHRWCNIVRGVEPVEDMELLI